MPHKKLADQLTATGYTFLNLAYNHEPLLDSPAARLGRHLLASANGLRAFDAAMKRIKDRSRD